MRALILAAGIGWRLGGGAKRAPKSLLRISGKTLMQRHLEILSRCGIGKVVIGVGYRADMILEEISALDVGIAVETVFNPDFEQGNIVTLWRLRDHLTHGGDVLLMDADVLYDQRMIRRLTESRHANCFLLDRELEPGDEPVKLCVRDGRLVEFRKQIAPDLVYDFHGESVGFFRLSAAVAESLRRQVDEYVHHGATEAFYEEAIRDLLLAADAPAFGYEDVTGLPWLEIDYPEDVRRANDEIAPKLIGPDDVKRGETPGQESESAPERAQDDARVAARCGSRRA